LDFFNKSTISKLALESRLPVGSSARMMAGLVIKARPILVLCCSPPDKALGKCLRRCSKPNNLIKLSRVSFFTFLLSKSRGKVMFSSIFNIGIKL